MINFLSAKDSKDLRDSLPWSSMHNSKQSSALSSMAKHTCKLDYASILLPETRQPALYSSHHPASQPRQRAGSSLLAQPVTALPAPAPGPHALHTHPLHFLYPAALRMVARPARPVIHTPANRRLRFSMRAIQRKLDRNEE